MFRLKVHVDQVSYVGDEKNPQREAVSFIISGVNSDTGDSTPGPTDNFKVYFDNPKDMKQIKNGADYYLTFTRIEPLGKGGLRDGIMRPATRNLPNPSAPTPKSGTLVGTYNTTKAPGTMKSSVVTGPAAVTGTGPITEKSKYDLSNYLTSKK